MFATVATWFYNGRVRWACVRGDVRGLATVLRNKRILPRLYATTCTAAEDALSRAKTRLFWAGDILEVSEWMDGNHPGWRLLTVMMDRAEERKAVGDIDNMVHRLAVLQARIIDEHFTPENLHFAMEIWLVCRSKLHEMIFDHDEFGKFPYEFRQRFEALHDARLISSMARSGLIPQMVSTLCRFETPKPEPMSPNEIHRMFRRIFNARKSQGEVQYII